MRSRSRAQIEIAAANAAANAVAHAHRIHTTDHATLRALLPSAQDGASCASSTGAQGGAPSSPLPNYGTPLLPASPSMHVAGASSWAVVTPSDWAAPPSAVPATKPMDEAP